MSDTKYPPVKQSTLQTEEEQVGLRQSYLYV